MAFYKVTKKQEGGGGIILKQYAKFNGHAITLPWTLNSDYKIEVIFYQDTYINDEHIIGTNAYNASVHLTPYSDKYYVGIGTGGEQNFGTWSSGEHKFVCNNGNNHSEFDDVEVADYTPTTNNELLTIGSRSGYENCYSYIKSYKIYSISSGALLHELKPALVLNNIAILYDTVTSDGYPVTDLTVMDTIPSS